MATYDGETARISATVKDFNKAPVPQNAILEAVVNLYDSDGNYVFTNEPLIWDATHGYWYFDWQNALPGTFTSQCVFNGNNFEAFGYGTVRVRPLKLIPTGQPTPIVN